MAELGLNPAQVEAVKATWGVVTQNLKEHGVNVFATLFRTHPDTQLLFRRLKHIPKADLETSAGLRAHAFGFMKELDGMMQNLECADELVIMIENNARRHYGRKVTPEHYKVVFDLFHVYLKAQLGDGLTDDAASGMRIVTDAINDILTKEYKAIAEESS